MELSVLAAPLGVDGKVGVETWGFLGTSSLEEGAGGCL